MSPYVAKAIQIMHNNWDQCPGSLYLFCVIMPRYFTQETWNRIFEDPDFKNHWANMPKNKLSL